MSTTRSTATAGEVVVPWYRCSRELHMPYEYFQGTPGAAAQRLRRQVDALSDCRGPHVFDAEDVRLVIEYLEANERARLAEHEADKRLCEQEETE